MMNNGSVSYYTIYGTPKVDNIYIYSSNVTKLIFGHPSTLISEGSLRSFRSLPNTTAPIEAYWPTALQKVYNLTSLYSKGYEGQNFTIGILDFAGNPYIQQQLAYYDSIVKLPNPPNFTIVPIGPYNPGLGIATGWDSEISLDVESAHTMAPRANMVLYIANLNLPLSAVIAYIDQQHKVNIISQSFSISESSLSSYPAPIYYTNIALTDVYYALGSVEGITFIASSGDVGGSGYSNGPLGTPGYPSTSPYVLSAGGTTTYIQFPNGSFYQTAWSNYGFVPNGVNYGGGTGGVSIVEPKPWYQWGITSPKTYPNGRLGPDVSANANVYPGIYIIGGFNQTLITGGTSEASPLLAGMLVAVMSYVNHSLGLINPLLYQIGENPQLYSKIFYPITFGYNIPWTSSYGYNLATGWGALNAGEFAQYLKSHRSELKSSLSIMVELLGPQGSQSTFMPGETMTVVANITINRTVVSSGSFNAVLEDLYGNVTNIPLTYNSSLGLWTGQFTLPSTANGILSVVVYGSSQGTSGYGFTETFSGYYVTFLSPVTMTPFYSGINPVQAVVTDINGNPAPTNFTVEASVYSYNITDNAYTFLTNITLVYNNKASEWVGILPANLTVGDDLIYVNNAYGIVAFSNGIYLQSLFIRPQVIAEPGAVAGGQSIIIQGTPLTNIPDPNIAQGITIKAELVNQQGEVVSQGLVTYSPLGQYYGYIPVPENLNAGLYTILLFASYNSSTLGQVFTGFYYGQIYVVPKYSVPQINIEKYVYQGQTVYVYANITYPNGTPVKYGMYSATVYPMTFSSSYSNISANVNIPLFYNPSIQLWEGNFTIPSASSLGNLSYFKGLTYFTGPFQILISGVSADGVPTTNDLSSAYTFYVTPYTLMENQTLSNVKLYNMVLRNVNITGNSVLGSNILQNVVLSNGNFMLVGSNVSSITVENANITIVNSQVASINAVNSNINLISTTVNSAGLTNSKISSEINSKILSVSPSLPTIQINVPLGNLTGTVNIGITVSGSQVSQVSLYLDNQLLTTFSGSGTFSYQLDTTKYPDGTYTLTVVAQQTTGLFNKTSTYVTFSNQLNQGLQSAHSEIQSVSSTLNNNLQSVSSTLDSRLSSQSSIATGALIAAIIALALGIVAIFIGRRK